MAALQNSFRYTLLLLITLTIIRLVIIGLTGPGDAEAYYWTWSQQLDWSYYDHPPMLAWIIAGFTSMAGDNAFGLRLAPVLIFNISGLLMYRLAADSFSPKAGFWAVALLAVTPAFFLGGISASPDVVLAPFCLAFFILFQRSLNKISPLNIILCGLLLGLGFLAKYFMLVIILPTLIILLFKPYRIHWRQPWFYLSSLLALILSLPVLYWNWINHWPSLKFHLVQRHNWGSMSLSNLATNLGQLVGGQILYFSPFLLALMVICLLRQRKKIQCKWPELHHPVLFLSVNGLVLLSFFFLVCLLTKESEPHWPAIGYLPLIALLGGYIAKNLEKPRQKREPWCGRYLYYLFIFPMVINGLLLVHLLTPLGLYVLKNFEYNPRFDLANELMGWPRVAAQVEQIIGPQEEVPLASYHYTICSQLWFASARGRPVYCLNNRLDQFDFFSLGDLPALKRDKILFIHDNRYNKKPQEIFRAKNIQHIKELTIERVGIKVRRFNFYFIEGYKGILPDIEGL